MQSRVNLDAINEVVMKKVMPGIEDSIFKSSPLFHFLRGKNLFKMKLHDVFKAARLAGYRSPHKDYWKGKDRW
jgi:hypothetical protein